LRYLGDTPPQKFDLGKDDRAELKGQEPAVIWFTGLPGAGKSTLANSLEKLLHKDGRHTMVLDGDNVRRGLNRDLGFEASDRLENVRRVAHVAQLMVDAGLIVIVALISPSRSERRWARELVGSSQFIEVFVDTPLKECIRRDPKGHYARALAGKIPDFTGISSNYEPPEDPEIRIDTMSGEPLHLALQIMKYLAANQLLTLRSPRSRAFV